MGWTYHLDLFLCVLFAGAPFFFFFMERLPDRIPNAGWGVAGLHGSVVGFAADSEGLRKVLWIPLDQLFLEWVSGCRDRLLQRFPMGFRGVPWGHWMFLRAAG